MPLGRPFSFDNYPGTWGEVLGGDGEVRAMKIRNPDARA